MRKLKYVFLFVLPIAIFIGCKKQDQVTGADGATGVQGVPGGNLYATNNPYSLDANSFSGAGPYYYKVEIFNNYNPNINYALEVYAHKVVGSGVQNKLPWFNVYTNGDELFSSMQRDSVIIWYYSPTAWPSSPGDSVMSFQVMIFPQQ